MSRIQGTVSASPRIEELILDEFYPSQWGILLSTSHTVSLLLSFTTYDVTKNHVPFPLSFDEISCLVITFFLNFCKIAHYFLYLQVEKEIAFL